MPASFHLQVPGHPRKGEAPKKKQIEAPTGQHLVATNRRGLKRQRFQIGVWPLDDLAVAGARKWHDWAPICHSAAPVQPGSGALAALGMFTETRQSRSWLTRSKPANHSVPFLRWAVLWQRPLSSSASSFPALFPPPSPPSLCSIVASILVRKTAAVFLAAAALQPGRACVSRTRAAWCFLKTIEPPSYLDSAWSEIVVSFHDALAVLPAGIDGLFPAQHNAAYQQRQR